MLDAANFCMKIVTKEQSKQVTKDKYLQQELMVSNTRAYNTSRQKIIPQRMPQLSYWSIDWQYYREQLCIICIQPHNITKNWGYMTLITVFLLMKARKTDPSKGTFPGRPRSQSQTRIQLTYFKFNWLFQPATKFQLQLADRIPTDFFQLRCKNYSLMN